MVVGIWHVMVVGIHQVYQVVGQGACIFVAADSRVRRIIMAAWEVSAYACVYIPTLAPQAVMMTGA